MKCKVCGAAAQWLHLDKFNVSCMLCGSFIAGNIFTPTATIKHLAEYVGLSVEDFQAHSAAAGNDLEAAKQYTADYVQTMMNNGYDRSLYSDYFDDLEGVQHS